MTNTFYWKCKVCREPIKENLTERYEDGRRVRYHKSCLDKQEQALKEADKLLGRRFKYE
jgi:hypothetical protein